MAGQREIQIVITARNMSDAELAKARASLAGFKKGTEDASKSTQSFFSTLAGGVAVGTLFSDALGKMGEVGLDVFKQLGAAIVDMTMQGSKELGIEKAFNRLTGQVGQNAKTVLEDLKVATHGTVEEFDLMVRMNENLAAGLNLTEKQYKTLAAGAFALAKATGTDVKDALNTMSDAMLTGRTRAVALLTGKIDLEDAEKRYAHQLGVTCEELSAEGKIEAVRVAIIESVGAAVDRLGAQTDDLGTKVKQTRAWWADFQDEIGKTIASSPVLMTFLNEAGGALSASFGVAQEAAVKRVGLAVDGVAISAVGLAANVAPVVGVIGTEFNALQVLFRNTMQVLDLTLLGVKTVALAGLEAADAVTLGGAFVAQQQRIRSEMAALVLAIDARKVAIAADKTAEDEWWSLGERLSTQLNTLQAKMAASRRTFDEHKGAVTESGEALAGNTDRLVDHGKAAKKAAEEATTAWLDAWQAMTQAGRDATADFQNSFKTIGGMLTQVDPSARSVGTQFEFLKWQIAGVSDTVSTKFLPLMPALKGNLDGVALTFREKFSGAIGKATDVVDQLSRVAEMSGHKTTAALLSTASATAKAFASGGPWAAAIAFASGMLTTFADKLFKIEGKKVNDLRDAFVSAAGGIDALNRQAVAAGTTLDAFLKAKTVKEYEAAVAALNTQLEKTAALQGELAGLQQQLADRQVMDWKRAEELVVKYGGTLGNLGAQFEGAKLHASFAEIWNDWQTLIDMGADVGGVLVSMKDEIQALVQQSLAIGTEIPAQFKPLIEELIRTGQLFDANGDAITDIAALKFGAPLVSEVDKIVTAIDKLVAALTDHLIPTIGKIPKDLKIKVGYDYDPYVPPSGGHGGGSGGGGGMPGYGAGALITSPHLAHVGEGGQPELIGPVAFMQQALAGAMAGLGMSRSAPLAAAPDIVFRPQIIIDGRQVAEALAPYLPDTLRRYGLVRT